MRIGLYGGTFDPIHLGHLRAAENAREELSLDRVAFLPAAVPPHRGAPASAASDRLAMVRLATSPYAEFEAWDHELRREGPSYTIETVEALLAAHPADSFVLVVGADTWPEIPTWREPERLLALVEVAVVDRPGCAAAPPTPPFPGARGARRVGGPGLQLSASLIRAHARSGRSVRFLVPDPVADYIGERGALPLKRLPPLVAKAARAALEKKAEDTLALDLRRVADFTDFFLLVTGHNQRQLVAIADAVTEALRAEGRRPEHVEGYPRHEWILLDYGSFVVHVMTPKSRSYYDLERLWGGSERLEVTG